MTTVSPVTPSPVSPSVEAEVQRFMKRVVDRTPSEPEFHQAVHEVVESVMPTVLDTQAYRDASVLDRLTEPDRVISFRVTWTGDDGAVHVNRGYRVQFSNAIGPYKGGLRFHPTVTQGTLKFLAFEQIFKNALTGLPMGGGKGGSDFDPKGKSDAEVMRFCHSFMTELYRHIGEDTDVPAGDIGVGAREIGFLFGQYKRLTNTFTPVITGKAPQFGGSLLRPEATGYGSVYFAQAMLEHAGEGLADKDCAVSGSGNVAQFTAEMLIKLGARVVTLSDSGGFIHDPNGIDTEKLAFVEDLKNTRRGRISEYAEKYSGATFHANERPWGVPVFGAFPSATQNEINEADAKTLVANGVRVVSEGANMPSTPDAVHAFQKAGVLFGPGKAANAGGVSVSGLEQSQNSQRLSWTRDEVDQKLHAIMTSIHAACVEHGSLPGGGVDYVRGANIAGFTKVADALVAFGAV
ncbi:MAG: NADP-specific glutamate dehydrogenase [Planctomycetota bacterium]